MSNARRPHRGRWVAALLGLALIVPGGRAQGLEPGRVSLGVCDMMVTATLDSAERLQRFLPAGYRTGTSVLTGGTREIGVLMFWVFDCDGVQVAGQAVGDVRFSFSTIAIETSERETAVTTTPRNFDLYAVHVHADDRGFAAWLNENGIPARVVDDIAIHRADGLVDYEIIDAETGYEMTVHPLHPDVIGRVHDHNNTFWHEGPEERTGVFRLQILNATDTACYLLAPCGELRAPAGTESASLLGDTIRPIHMAFDHVRLGEVTASVTSS